MSHKYKIKYDLDPETHEVTTEVGEWTAEEVQEFGGGTDALLVFSLLYPEDGSFSMFHFSTDGRNDGEEISDEELFKVWSLLSNRLAGSKTLSEGKREFAKTVFDAFRQVMLGGHNCDHEECCGHES